MTTETHKKFVLAIRSADLQLTFSKQVDFIVPEECKSIRLTMCNTHAMGSYGPGKYCVINTTVEPRDIQTGRGADYFLDITSPKSVKWDPTLPVQIGEYRIQMTVATSNDQDYEGVTALDVNRETLKMLKRGGISVLMPEDVQPDPTVRLAPPKPAGQAAHIPAGSNADLDQLLAEEKNALGARNRINEVLTEANTEIKQLKKTTEELETRRAEVTAAVQELAENKAELEKNRAEHEAALATFNTDKAFVEKDGPGINEKARALEKLRQENIAQEAELDQQGQRLSERAKKIAQLERIYEDRLAAAQKTKELAESLEAANNSRLADLVSNIKHNLEIPSGGSPSGNVASLIAFLFTASACLSAIHWLT
jgi:hypothetical protein